MEVDEREEFASVSNEPVAGPSNQVAGGPSTGDAPFPTKNAGVNQGAGKAGGGKKANHHKGEGRTRKKGKGSRGDDEEEERQLTIEEKLAISPYDYELHVQNIKNAATYEEREQGRIFMSQMIALLEQDWLEWIKDKKSHEGASLESKVEILELYKRACADLLCTSTSLIGSLLDESRALLQLFSFATFVFRLHTRHNPDIRLLPHKCNETQVYC